MRRSARMALRFPTRAERPGHLPHAASLRQRLWPEFLYHDPVLERLFVRVMAEDAEFQFYAWDDAREEVVGVGMAVPASWEGDPGEPARRRTRRRRGSALRGGRSGADCALRA